MTDNEKLDLILARLSSVEKQLDKMDGRLDKMDNRLDDMDIKMEDMKTEITAVKLIIENELRVNIQRVAEGHLDLSRNLHEALKQSKETEMLSIRVGVLESEVRTLKQRISS